MGQIFCPFSSVFPVPELCALGPGLSPFCILVCLSGKGAYRLWDAFQPRPLGAKMLPLSCHEHLPSRDRGPEFELIDHTQLLVT